jgi:LDH2 family malate/lactate/ureidoglycolate dehydrogenase
MNELRRRVGESLRVSGPLWTGSLILERVLRVNVLGRWPVRQVPVERVRGQVLAILDAWGMPEAEAATTADHMIYPDLCGIDGHGVAMLLHYQRSVREGSMAVPASVEVVSEGPATALIDGGGGLGHVPADLAMRMAIAKARESGVAAVLVRNSGHFGAAGSYTAMAAEAGLLGLVTTNALRPALVPTFGAEAMLGTNAISFAAPSAAGKGFLLDMATSTASMGKVWATWREGRRIPAGWAVDSRGNPVRNGRIAATQRRLTPLGSRPENASHKGYGLAAMVEILSAALTGQTGRETGVGHFFCAVDPGRFREDDGFERDLDLLTDSLRGSRPLAPARPVLVAGDPERAAREDRLRAGIPLPRGVIEDIRTVARRSRVPFSL